MEGFADVMIWTMSELVHLEMRRHPAQRIHRALVMRRRHHGGDFEGEQREVDSAIVHMIGVPMRPVMRVPTGVADSDP